VHVVDDLLNQLTTKFSTMSSELIEKSKSTYGQMAMAIVVQDANVRVVDEMSRRLDNLEATIQAGSTQTESDVEK
jgi:heat shock factor-binding protein 1